MKEAENKPNADPTDPETASPLPERLLMGTALRELGRRLKLTNADLTFELDHSPATSPIQSEPDNSQAE
jgi:hypothetical protein